MLIAATVLFVLHAGVAGLDGMYFHIFKYKLYAHPESVLEHFTHTLRTVFMAVTAYIFFVVNAGGWLLWLGLAAIFVDLCVQTWDILIERRSRASMGGLSSVEYLSHANAILLYAGTFSLVVAAKPSGAFALSSPAVLQPYPPLVSWIGWAVCIVGILATIQHVVLLHPSFRRTAET